MTDIEPNPAILLGDPFAIISGADFHEPTLLTAITCDCGQAFQFDLLNGSPKGCPGCGTRFTHILLVCPEDDGEAATELVQHLLENGAEGEIDADPTTPPKDPAPDLPNAT